MTNKEQIISYINTLKSNDFVYESVIKRKFGIELNMTNDILESLFLDTTMLKRVHYPYCSECKELSPKYFKNNKRKIN